MMTLGWGEARLARVPSGQMMASPVKMPRRPSSQVTSVPWRVQFCAMAEEAVATAAAERRSENTSARVIIATVPLLFGFRPAQSSAIRPGPVQTGFKRVPGRAELRNYSNEVRKFLAWRPAPLQNRPCPVMRGASGEMAEWLKAHAWKACVRETVPWVRIPLSPPRSSTISLKIFVFFKDLDD